MNSPNTRPTVWKFQSHRLAWHRPQDVTPPPPTWTSTLGSGLNWACSRPRVG